MPITFLFLLLLPCARAASSFGREKIKKILNIFLRSRERTRAIEIPNTLNCIFSQWETFSTQSEHYQVQKTVADCAQPNGTQELNLSMKYLCSTVTHLGFFLAKLFQLTLSWKHCISNLHFLG